MSGCTVRKPNREGLARVDGTPRALEKNSLPWFGEFNISDVPFVARSVQSGRWSMNSQRVMSICRTHMGFRKVRKNSIRKQDRANNTKNRSKLERIFLARYWGKLAPANRDWRQLLTVAPGANTGVWLYG